VDGCDNVKPIGGGGGPYNFWGDADLEWGRSLTSLRERSGMPRIREYGEGYGWRRGSKRKKRLVSYPARRRWSHRKDRKKEGTLTQGDSLWAKGWEGASDALRLVSSIRRGEINNRSRQQPTSTRVAGLAVTRNRQGWVG